MSYQNIIGILGVGLILVAYFAHTLGWISGTSRAFFILNAIGAALACYASYLIGYWPFVILEGIWFLVSLLGLFRTLKKNNHED